MLKKYFLQFCRVLFFLMLALLFLELILQISAGFSTGNKNFYQHINKIKAAVSGMDVEKTIFFVGDSTIYGIGSSEPDRYSLPSQFERFLRMADSDFCCVNLGYVGSSTEDLLQILSLLPEGALIIYRGGFVDVWNTGNPFLFKIAGYSFEFRSLKMLYMLFPGALPDSIGTRAGRIHRQMKDILDTKKQRIFLLQYTNYQYNFGFLRPFVKEGRIGFIPLREILDPAFLIDGYLNKNYRNMSGSHPNDMGYYVESLFLFNYCCEHSLFRLSPEQSRENGDFADFVGSLQKKHEEAKKELAGFSMEQLFSAGQERRRFKLMQEAWELADILYSFTEEKDKWLFEREGLEKLAVLVFHDPMFIGHYLLGVHTEKTGCYTRIAIDEDKLRLYYYIMKAAFSEDSVHWHLLSAARIDSLVSKFEAPISYYADISPYPLEFCAKFQQESGFSAQDLSTRSEWQYFFPDISYEAFSELEKSACFVNN